MAEDPDRELEHYVWQHKHETLRKIQEGMEEELGRTKSTKWIKPRRDAAIQAEQDPGLEVEIPTEEEIKEEETDETKKDEETTVEDDPEVIKINEQRRRLEAEIKRVEAENLLVETKKKLALARTGQKNIEDLEKAYDFYKDYTEENLKYIMLLTQAIKKALKTNSRYDPHAECPECEQCFLLKVDEKNFKCYVCGTECHMHACV